MSPPAPIGITLGPEHVVVPMIVVAAIALIGALAVVVRNIGGWRDRLPRGANARRSLFVAVVVLVGAATVFGLLANAGQLDSVATRIEHASPGLLSLAVGLECLSFGGYIVLTWIVFHPVAPRIRWVESVEITFAGVVATRLFTAGGAGGIALTGWALHGAGLDTRDAARMVTTFLVILYSIFFGVMCLAGLGAATGLIAGSTPLVLTIGGAFVGAAVIGLALASLLVPQDLERRARRAAAGAGPVARLASRVATVPAVAGEAIATALRTVRGRPAAIAWWGFDIGVLWATFEMFGEPPDPGTLIVCYFVGQLAQVIPIPGGIGPVEGGMIGAFAASGIPFDLALIAVLSYQAISTWLPAVPGLWGYLRLRHSVADWQAPSGAAQAA